MAMHERAVYLWTSTSLFVCLHPIITSTCPLHTNSGVGKRVAYELVHDDLARQHLFGTTLRFAGPVPVDSRQ